MLFEIINFSRIYDLGVQIKVWVRLKTILIKKPSEMDAVHCF